MVTNSLRSAGIAGFIAFILYLVFSTLFNDASISANMVPSILWGVGTFVVTLLITLAISSYYKNQRKQ